MNTPTNDSKVIAYVAPLSNDKFVCVANLVPVAKSGDITYFERHYAANSKAIKKMDGVDVEKFVYLTNAGKVDHIDIVSRATNAISKLISKPPKGERLQIQKEAKLVFELVKNLKLV